LQAPITKNLHAGKDKKPAKRNCKCPHWNAAPDWLGANFSSTNLAVRLFLLSLKLSAAIGCKHAGALLSRLLRRCDECCAWKQQVGGRTNLQCLEGAMECKG
jgi:hypothetical protein